jgi:hypothetical protein
MAINSLSELRKTRGSLSVLTQEIEKSKAGGDRKEDERMWQCKTDSAGNGTAVIRFLPAPKGEDSAWVKMFSHGFKGPTGKWYIENSRTTLAKGEPDPVSELNNQLWSTKLKSNEDIARSQKRKLSYYSNILIISDPANPENEGKVKIFRYGQKIFDILEGVIKPEFEDDVAFNPFDFWDGANFRLKIIRKDGYANFDKSSLAEPKAISDDDAELEKIWDQCYSLQELISPDKFKSYDELAKKLTQVLATGETPKRAEQLGIDEDDEAFMRANARKKPAADPDFDDPAAGVDTEASKPKPKPAKKAAAIVDDEADDDLDYFRKLAED